LILRPDQTVTIAGIAGHDPGISGHDPPEYPSEECTKSEINVQASRKPIHPIALP